jgi:hypothetical protein
MHTKVRLYGPKPSKYIKTKSNYHRILHQDASYVFSTNIPACSTTKLNLLTRIKGSGWLLLFYYDFGSTVFLTFFRHLPARCQPPCGVDVFVGRAFAFVSGFSFFVF